MRTKAVCLAATFMLVLASCGGEGPGLAGSRGGSEAPGGGGGGGGGNGDDEPAVFMGNTTDGSFQEGAVGIGTTNLASGGSTSISVQLRSGDAPYSELVEVTFSSDCESAGRAEIEETTVTTSNGTATTTYNDLGCPGSDTITARANINGQTLRATGALTVAAANLGSIEFVSAEPDTIGLKGTGAAGIKETSVIKFRVLNDVGGPMPDQDVTFSLSTSVGGLSLSSSTATSGVDGTISTTLRSGTVPISARVTATVDDTNVATQSSALTVTTAIPDQNSFSLSASNLSPEAWGTDGVEVELTVLAADRFNNLVPDDTAIIFTTELGAIVGKCMTENGGCSATWRSQDPRDNSDNDPFDTGRTTILAHAIGEESFYDDDGNGVFDGTQACPDLPAKPPADEDCFYDLPEAWLDSNENGVRNSPTEPFVDFDSNGSYDSANGEWDGIVCGGGTCTANLVNVSDSIVLVMARTFADILIFDGAGNADTGPFNINGGTTITFCIAGEGTFVPAAPATIGGIMQAQTMPSGTTIKFEASVGELLGKDEFIIPGTVSEQPRCYDVNVVGDGTGGPGILEVTVTAPSAAETYTFVRLNDS